MTRDRVYLFDTTLRDGQQTLPHARSRLAGEDLQNKNRAAVLECQA